MNWITTPSNPNAQPCVHKLMAYLGQLAGHGILTGQHTKTRGMEELRHIEKITGKQPALVGFELLSYSPNINYWDTDDECMDEVAGNYGTLRQAWEWAAQKGVVTFTWHWFSPLGGRSKSFFSVNTDFDATRALIDGTPENKALLQDMDMMAALLRPFCEAGVPILWRPFHEAEGDWFWWGVKGVEVAKELYRFMFRYYTEKHHLDNLIWVWNSPLPEGYVGDEYCDIITRDQYPPAYAYSDFRDNYEGLLKITDAKKGTAVAETGIIPDADMLVANKTPWLWYMTWSGGFVLTEEFNEFSALKRLYEHEYAVTLDKLPRLY